MSFPTNPPPPHRRSQVDPSLCVGCRAPWPCATERRARELEGKVPPWTTEDELNLGERVRRLRR